MGLTQLREAICVIARIGKLAGAQRRTTLKEVLPMDLPACLAAYAAAACRLPLVVCRLSCAAGQRRAKGKAGP